MAVKAGSREARFRHGSVRQAGWGSVRCVAESYGTVRQAGHGMFWFGVVQFWRGRLVEVRLGKG